jgi:hypothetical protein
MVGSCGLWKNFHNNWATVFLKPYPNYSALKNSHNRVGYRKFVL